MPRQLDILLDTLSRAVGDRAGETVHQILDEIDRTRNQRRNPAGHDPIAVIERWFDRRTERRVSQAERAVVSSFHYIDGAVQAEVSTRLGPKLAMIGAELLRDPTGEQAPAGLAVLRVTRDWMLIPIAAGHIGAHSPELSRQAIEAIEACVASDVQDPPLSAGVFSRSLAAILDAASTHATGADRAVLRSTLLVLTPAVLAGVHGPNGRSWLDRAPEAIRLAMRSSLRTLPGPSGLSRAIDLLPRPELRRAAAERIAAADGAAEHQVLRERAHLLIRPVRSQVLQSRLDREQLSNLVAVDDRMTAEEARGLPALLSALQAHSTQGELAIEPLLAHSDRLARLAGSRAAGDQLRLDFCLDADERVAWSALLRMVVPPDARERTRLTAALEHPAASLCRRSQHRSVRGFAERLTDSQPLATAVVSLRQEFMSRPSGVIDRLATGLSRAEPAAFAFTARLELADELLEPLAEVIAAHEPRSTASAVKTLAHARSQQATSLIEAATRSYDPRVRSNALEAAATRTRRRLADPLPLLPDDEHHRPAATSLRLQLIAGAPSADASERICEMLRTADPNRRAAGLWVTERSARELKPVAGRRWAEIASRVAESARRGESVRERQRATRCARRMLAVTSA